MSQTPQGAEPASGGHLEGAGADTETPDLAGQAAEAEYEQFVWSNLKRNYAAHYIHGMLGMTGFRLVNAPTFLPAYIYSLSGSNAIVGLALGLQQLGGIVSPVIGAQQIEHRSRVMPVAMVMGTLMRVPILLMAIAGWTLHGTPLLITLVAMLFFLGLFGGSQRVVFQLLLAKVIPMVRRGRLQAWRNVTGGLIAAALSYFAGRYLIQHNVFGNGYSTTFLIAFVLTSLGLTALRMLMREPIPPTTRAQTSLRARLEELPGLLREDRNYRNFLIAQALAMGGRMAAPFYILHVAKVVHLDGAGIGLFSLAFLGADTLSNLVWGYLGDKSGFRSSFLVALVLWIGATALLIFAHDVPTLLLAFVGLGAAGSGYQMSSQTIVLEFGTRDDIPMRLAISSTVEGAMSTIAPLVGGLIATAAGYPAVFVAAIVTQSAALALLTLGVKEPRLKKSAA